MPTKIADNFLSIVKYSDVNYFKKCAIKRQITSK